MTIEFDSYLYMTVMKRFSLKDMEPRWAEMALAGLDHVLSFPAAQMERFPTLLTVGTPYDYGEYGFLAHELAWVRR